MHPQRAFDASFGCAELAKRSSGECNFAKAVVSKPQAKNTLFPSAQTCQMLRESVRQKAFVQMLACVLRYCPAQKRRLDQPAPLSTCHHKLEPPSMRVLVIYCHPVATSCKAALHQEMVAGSQAAGCDADDCDLHAENFNPVLSRAERLNAFKARVSQAMLRFS